MELWLEWFKGAAQLRDACTRKRTFAWMIVVLAAMSVRADLAGVTSFVRGLLLKPSVYRRLLYLFHSPALDIRRLTQLWIQLVQTIFIPVKVDGRRVCLADGLKIPKEGRKMPAVKKAASEFPKQFQTRIHHGTFLTGHVSLGPKFFGCRHGRPFGRPNP